MNDTIYRQDAIDALEGVDWYHINETTGKMVHGSTSDMESWYKVDDVRKAIEKLQSAQPDDRIKKIADILEGTIDHFDRDDAMDLLYQVKEVLR